MSDDLLSDVLISTAVPTRFPPASEYSFHAPDDTLVASVANWKSRLFLSIGKRLSEILVGNGVLVTVGVCVKEFEGDTERVEDHDVDEVGVTEDVNDTVGVAEDDRLAEGNGPNKPMI